MKILIVDDEILVRRSLERVFKTKGHEVVIAEDGEQGLAFWQSFQPELVVLDILMPKMTGPQVLEKMQGRSLAKVILISAYSGEYSLETAKNLGAHLFIQKPFDDIFDVLRQCEDVIND